MPDRAKDDSPETEHDLLAAADDAVAALSGMFLESLADDIARLRDDLATAAGVPEHAVAATAAIFGIAHNIKGQGESFGYPLATQIGALMCAITRDRSDAPSAHELEILGRYVDALALVRDHDIVGSGGDAGRTLIERLTALGSA